MTEKLCTACAETKPISEFHKHGDGWRSQCKPCRTAKVRDWYDASRVERIAQKKAYTKDNSAKVGAYQARYRSINRDKLARDKAAYYVAHRDRIRGYLSDWRRDNADYIREVSRRTYWQDPQAEIAKVCARAKANPEAPRQRAHRRRARLAGAEATLTKEEWSAILEWHDHRCAYCLRHVKKPEIEHVIPIARGGSHAADNVVPACKHCNSTKRDKLIFVMLSA